MLGEKTRSASELLFGIAPLLKTVGEEKKFGFSPRPGTSCFALCLAAEVGILPGLACQAGPYAWRCDRGTSWVQPCRLTLKANVAECVFFLVLRSAAEAFGIWLLACHVFS